MLLHYMLKTLFNEIVIFRTSATSQKVCELRATTFLQQASHFLAVFPSRGQVCDAMGTSHQRRTVTGAGTIRDAQEFPGFSIPHT